MSRSSRVILTVIAGVIALVVGYFSAGASKEPTTEGAMERQTVPASVEASDVAKGVNPELLTELRRVAMKSRSIESLSAEDFPGAIEAAHEAGDNRRKIELLKRWSQLDCPGMVDYFLGLGRFCLPMGERSWESYEDMILGLLVEEDPHAAWNTALRFPKKEGYRRSVLGVIARKSPDLALKLAMENLESFQGGGGYFHLGEKTNLKLAAALVEREPFGALELELLKDVYFAGNPSAPFEMWKSFSEEKRAATAAAFMPGKDDGSEMAGEFYDVLASRIANGEERDPQFAWKFFDVYGARMFKEAGVAGSLDWIEAHAPVNVRSTASWRVIDSALKSGVSRDEVLVEIDSLFSRGQGMKNLAGSVVSQVFKDDRLAALEWVAGLPADQSAVAGASQLGSLWAKESEADLRSALEKLPAGKHAETFLLTISMDRRQKLGAEKALQWALELPPESSGSSASWLMRIWAGEDGPAAAAFVDEMDRGAPVREELFRALTYGQLNRGEADRREWIATLDPADRELARHAVQISTWQQTFREELTAELGRE